MKIRVETKNVLLGNSVFWEGNSNEINKIRNIPARKLARLVKEDGETRRAGMWKVSKIK